MLVKCTQLEVRNLIPKTQFKNNLTQFKFDFKILQNLDLLANEIP